MELTAELRQLHTVDLVLVEAGPFQVTDQKGGARASIRSRSHQALIIATIGTCWFALFFGIAFVTMEVFGLHLALR